MSRRKTPPKPNVTELKLRAWVAHAKATGVEPKIIKVVVQIMRDAGRKRPPR